VAKPAHRADLDLVPACGPAAGLKKPSAQRAVDLDGLAWLQPGHRPAQASTARLAVQHVDARPMFAGTAGGRRPRNY